MSHLGSITVWTTKQKCMVIRRGWRQAGAGSGWQLPKTAAELAVGIANLGARRTREYQGVPPLGALRRCDVLPTVECAPREPAAVVLHGAQQAQLSSSRGSVKGTNKGRSVSKWEAGAVPTPRCSVCYVGQLSCRDGPRDSCQAELTRDMPTWVTLQASSWPLPTRSP